MSILIKGMEMPSIDLEWRIIHGQDGKWYAIDVNAETSDGEWHEIVPVPPHGRLIKEADAIETVWMILTGLGYRKEENPQLEQTVREVFSTVPAIEVE